MSIVSKAGKNAVTVIKTHKLLVVILFLIQFLFFVSIASINVTYPGAIVRNIQNMVIPLENANYDENAIRAGSPFLQDAVGIYDNYQQMVANIKKLVFYQLAAFLALNLWCWALTQYLFKKENVLTLLGSEVARAVTFIIPAVILDYALVTLALNQIITDADSLTIMPATVPLYAAVGVTTIATYFMLVALALPHDSIKKCIQRALVLGIKKFHYIAGVLVINAGTVGIFGYLVSLSVTDWVFWLMAVFIALFILAFVIARIVFVSIVHEIDGNV